ncbi:MAG: sulfate transporter family protein [Parvibaculum sp.]|nr:sulfate transporter family protein [Parvibaculum sp.]
MLSDAFRALAQVFSQPFRQVLWLSLLSTIVVLGLFGTGAQWALAALPTFGATWADTMIEWVARFFAIIVLIPLVHPVVSLVAGLFLERIAAKVEASDYPADPAGRDQPFAQSLLVSLRFTLVLIVVNIIALPFYLLPGINLILFWVVNGYLLGREYFELVALRHLPIQEARALRKQQMLRVFLAGIVIAAFATVPFLNLLTPLFATAYMVHTTKRIGLK